MANGKDEATEVAPHSVRAEDNASVLVEPEEYERDVARGQLNAALQPVHSALPAPEETEVEVHLTGERPSGPISGDVPFEGPKGIEATISDERDFVAERLVRVKMLLDDVDDPNVQRMERIAGGRLRIFREGERAHGFVTMVNVETLEQIRVAPGGKYPAGKWVNVSYLPEEFVASLR